MSQKRMELEAAIALARRLRNRFDIRNLQDRYIIHEAMSRAARMFVEYTVDTHSITWPEYFYQSNGVKRDYCDYLQDELNKFEATALDHVIIAWKSASELQEKFLFCKTLPFPAPKELVGDCMRANAKLYDAFKAYVHERTPWPISLSAIEEFLYWEKGIEADPVDENEQLRKDAESIINCIYPVYCSYWSEEHGFWQVFYEFADGTTHWAGVETIDDAWDFVITHVGPVGDGFTKEGWRRIFSRVSLETFKRIWRQYEQDEELMKLIFKKME
jgi:hypothetical protein